MSGGRSDDVIPNSRAVQEPVLHPLQPIIVPVDVFGHGIGEIALVPLAVIPGPDDELLRHTFARQALIPGEIGIQRQVSPSRVLEHRDFR